MPNAKKAVLRAPRFESTLPALPLDLPLPPQFRREHVVEGSASSIVSFPDSWYVQEATEDCVYWKTRVFLFTEENLEEDGVFNTGLTFSLYSATEQKVPKLDKALHLQDIFGLLFHTEHKQHAPENILGSNEHKQELCTMVSHRYLLPDATVPTFTNEDPEASAAGKKAQVAIAIHDWLYLPQQSVLMRMCFECPAHVFEAKKEILSQIKTSSIWQMDPCVVYTGL